MKKLITFLLLLIGLQPSSAKKVKFAVDMTGVPINVTGIHIAGDFQAAAGFPGGDWVSNSTTLTQEGITAIYSIIVEIPAFAKYEFTYINGDQFYEAEFVPIESRVDSLTNANRWLYIDSLANDTTFVGAIPFSGNAPAGLTLVRYVVDMQGTTISSNGIHVAGNFQGWDPMKTILYSFTPAYYEVISYVPAGTYEYKFYNGNQLSSSEIVPGSCNVNSNREVVVTADIVLPFVCYSSCGPCVVGIGEFQNLFSMRLAPNPASEGTLLSWENNELIKRLYITDLTGRMIEEKIVDGNEAYISVSEKPAGIYLVHLSADKTQYKPLKLIVD